jgi:hypothetical protein
MESSAIAEATFWHLEEADVGDAEGVERGKDRADALVGNGGSSRVDGGEVHEEAFFLSR